MNPSKSNQEVESSTQRLCILIEQVVATNRDISTRLCRLETQSSRRPIEDNLSLITAEHGDADARRSIQYHATGLSSSFERFLHTSRAYGHCHFQHSETSLTSSDRRTNAFSTFTSLSLADISDISVFSLPIYASDISNSNWYTFGLPRQRGFSETVHTESVHSRTVMNPLPTLNQSSNPFGRMETGNDAEVIDRRANKPRNNAKNRERLSFQSVQRQAEKQRAIQRVDYQEAQTPEKLQTNNQLEEQPQLAKRPASDNEEKQVPESPQVINDLGEQHHVTKSTPLTPEPVLRGVAPTSPALLYKFETHARTGVSCHNPYEVCRLGRRLCDEGHELAQEIACLLYKNPRACGRNSWEKTSESLHPIFSQLFFPQACPDGHEDSIEIKDLQLQSYLFPPDYVQIRGLLRAMEKFLQDRRQKHMSSPHPTVAHSLRFKNRESRSRHINPRQSTDSLTDSIQDCGSNLVGKMSQSQRPRALNRVSSYYPNPSQGSFPQVDHRRQSII